MGEHVEPARERVRLVDVALTCGVTKSVASRALNDDPSLTIRPATRLRILAAARELGYRPHAGARALAGARTRALALLIPDLSNPVYSRIVRGACRRARERGYVVLLVADTPADGADETFADLVEEGRVDGLLIASARRRCRLLRSARRLDPARPPVARLLARGPAAPRVRQPGDAGFRAQRRDGSGRGQRHGRASPVRARAHGHRPGVRPGPAVSRPCPGAGLPRSDDQAGARSRLLRQRAV